MDRSGWGWDDDRKIVVVRLLGKTASPMLRKVKHWLNSAGLESRIGS